jgi:hypothetical protein
MKKFLSVRKLISHSRGVAIIEFVLALPILLIIFSILHDVARMYLAKSNLTRAVATMADILSQGVTDEDVEVTSAEESGFSKMFWVLLFPDLPIPTSFQNIELWLRSSGTDGTSNCVNKNLIPLSSGGGSSAPSFTAGSTQPEVVVSGSHTIKIPLLSGVFGTGLGPKMTFYSLERRFMRGVMFNSSGNVIIRPLFPTPEMSNPICNPPR